MTATVPTGTPRVMQYAHIARVHMQCHVTKSLHGTSDLDSTGRTEWTFDCLGMPPTNISETVDIANLNETSELSAPNKADIYSVAADKRTLHGDGKWDSTLVDTSMQQEYTRIQEQWQHLVQLLAKKSSAELATIYNAS